MDRSDYFDRFRRMDRKNLLITILIVVFAFILLILLVNLNSAWRQKQYRVLTTRTELTRGARISANQLAWKVYPIDQVHADYYTQNNTSPTDLSGGVAMRQISAGEPITRTNTLSPSVPVNYEALLQPNMRAVMLPMGGVGANFVQSGDAVDVILTFNPRTLQQAPAASARYGGMVTKTLFRNVLVLGVFPPGKETGTASASNFLTIGQSQNIKWVTFEVTPKQAEMMILADKMGTISLSLQGELVGQSIEGRSYTTANAVAGLNRAGEPNTVTIIRGSAKEVISLER